MTPEQMVADLARRKSEAEAERASERSAAAKPHDADFFAAAPDILLGSWRVRPFYDVDWEFLQALDHPWYHIMVAAFAGQSCERTFIPRGKDAWQLAWVFTRPTTAVEAELQAGGAVQVNDKARAEFSLLNGRQLRLLCEAVDAQQAIYWRGAELSPREAANASTNPSRHPPGSPEAGC